MRIFATSKKKSGLRSKRGASEISQFIPALYILFLVVFLPLLNLGNLFVAAAIQYLCTSDCASKAATQPDYASALNSMATEAYNFQGMGLSKFIRMVPHGGYTGCGTDMYVLSTDITSGAVTTSQPDQPLASPVDTKKSMYELKITSNFSVAPLINLASVPLLGDVPGLGQPVNLSFTAHRPAEHPGGLTPSSNNGIGNNSGGGVSPFNRVTTGSFVTNSAWRDPNLYPQIQASGQTIIASAVILIQANNPNWTDTNITVAPGDKIWLDTQAVGQWTSGLPTNQMLDANGYGLGSAVDANNTAPGVTDASLAGRIGTTGTPFFLGDEQFNYPPPGSSAGTFSMIFNDIVGEYSDNKGAQEVRIVVTR